MAAPRTASCGRCMAEQQALGRALQGRTQGPLTEGCCVVMPNKAALRILKTQFLTTGMLNENFTAAPYAFFGRRGAVCAGGDRGSQPSSMEQFMMNH